MVGAANQSRIGKPVTRAMTRALILGWMLGTIFPALAVGMVVTASIGGFILPLFLFTTVFTWFFISGAILLT